MTVKILHGKKEKINLKVLTAHRGQEHSRSVNNHGFIGIEVYLQLQRSIAVFSSSRSSPSGLSCSILWMHNSMHFEMFLAKTWHLPDLDLTPHNYS